MRKITKQNFIDIISTSTPEELNKIILNKSKPRKLVRAITKVGSDLEEINYLQEESKNGKSEGTY